MSNKTTSKLCANYGHNFYRVNSTGNRTDEIKCKQCGITIEMHNNKDINEALSENSLLNEAFKKIFLLRNRLQLRSKRNVFPM